jgi:hypothetical protein
MTRRQRYIAFTTISFAVALFLVGKFIALGMIQWKDFWFAAIFIGGCLIVSFLIDLVGKRNRRQDPTDSEGPL